MGLIDSDNTDMTAVCSVFDNEETGSSTKQGAASDFLESVLERICREFEKQSGEFVSINSLLASSFMVSADNGHAKHPNHPEFSDPSNFPLMNKGIVVKFNASQKYTTDAPSASIFIEICKRAGVPYQLFHNRSDALGGSTLGSISNTRVALSTVDIGLAQLAMHSSYETAGTHDVEGMIRTMTELYNSTIVSESYSNYKLLK
jgi:aspartyl aminopeptidase